MDDKEKKSLWIYGFPPRDQVSGALKTLGPRDPRKAVYISEDLAENQRSPPRQMIQNTDVESSTRRFHRNTVVAGFSQVSGRAVREAETWE
jgi:hypothetical protein